MTHLLIPIADIEARLALTRASYDETEKKLRAVEYSENAEDFDSIEQYEKELELLEGAISAYEDVLKSFKPISLDEKDIESKGDISVDKAPIELDSAEAFSWVNGYSSGYEQALKDLK